MKQSQLFTKTIREVPKEEKSINSQLLIRAGFVDKLMAGVYSYLPLGFRVLKKIENIIREEIGGIFGQEVLLPALHPKKNWQKTGRWQQEEMFKLKSRRGKDYSLGWTHEEIITPLVKKFVKSYKDLPVSVYQIQDKFRDELRAKSGLLRGVEFLMKDLYSFHRDEKDLDKYYEKVKKVYFKIFKRCGLGKQTFLTLASGGTFSKYSHEFQTITSFGEDEIYLCQKCKLAINKEIIKEERYRCPECKSKKPSTRAKLGAGLVPHRNEVSGAGLELKKAIEVGNIFKLKDKFSKAFNFNFRDEQGKEKPVLMGCYGIGLGRLMGAIVEVHHDQKGIIWPREVAPYQIHLIEVLGGPRPFFKKGGVGVESKVKSTAERLYKNLQKNGIEILYDDRRDKSPGEKFADADLIGIPLRIVISERTLENKCVELKRRSEKRIKLVKVSEITSLLRKNESIKNSI